MSFALTFNLLFALTKCELYLMFIAKSHTESYKNKIDPAGRKFNYILTRTQTAI